MLARAVPAAYLCPRCQICLWPIRRLRYPSTEAKRWTSTAIAPSKPEVDENGSKDVLKDPPEHSFLTPPRRDRVRYRSWKPKPSAHLGVNALGKPAEVLILPSRDRRIPEVPKEDDESGQQGKPLQETLDQERYPLSQTQLMENIDQTRLRLEKQRGQLEASEWLLLDRSLRQGFTHHQLRQYVALKSENPASRSTQRILTTPQKGLVVRFIVEEIWGFNLPTAHDANARSPKKTPTTRRTIGINDETKIDHLLNNPRHPLKPLLRGLSVQINFSRKSSSLIATGASADVQEAIRRISRYAKDLKSITLDLQSRPLPPLLLKSISERYGVSCVVKGNRISMIHSEQSGKEVRAVEQARREILLATEIKLNQSPLAIWPAENGQNSRLEPFPDPRKSPTTRGESWQRLISFPTTPPPTSPQGLVILQKFMCRHLGLLNPGNEGSHSEPYTQVYATFGQLLTTKPATSAPRNLTQGAELTTVASESHTAGSGAENQSAEERNGFAEVINSEKQCFTAELPFLPQKLAQMTPHTGSESYLAAPNVRALLRLELLPTNAMMATPVLELYVSVTDEHPRSRPALKLTRVLANHSEALVTILCPQLPVDVRFTRRLQQELFLAGARSRGAHLKPLLDGLKAYVSTAQGPQSEWTFRPFISLEIPPALAQISDSHNIQETSKQSGSSQSEVETVEYLLKRVEVVDIDTRRVHAEDNMYLEHVTYTAADATRQDLRLSQASMFESCEGGGPVPESFLRSALELAQELGRQTKHV